jgi:transketolase
MDDAKKKDLMRLAAQIRIKTIRCMESFGGGHIGGAMSIADVLAVLYGDIMRYDAANPGWDDRDRLVVSKGHSGPALYAALSLSGFFPDEWLYTLNQGGTLLPSHCDRNRTPGIDMSTGSLGQGVSVACGIATALARKGNPARVFAILGDGELQEGQAWEAMQYIAHRKPSNLTIIIDNNQAQLDGKLSAICEPFDLEEKFRSFGLECNTAVGYDVEAIRDGLMRRVCAESPGVLILKTTKGIGCKFAEEASFNHYMNFGKNEADEAVEEIERRLARGVVAKEAE